MKALAWINTGAFVATLAASSAVAWVPFLRSHVAARPPVASAISGTSESFSSDHLGAAIPRAEYGRIVSASTVADWILLELCEPDRILAFTARSARNAANGFRFAGKAEVDLDDAESILRLHPDLVLVNAIGDPRRLARLREAGLFVVDLGELRGMSTLVADIRKVAAFVGRPQRGERFVQEIVDRMNSIASDVPAARRRHAMYLSTYGGRLFGGAQGTSFHDILVAAGLVDAAGAFHDWPQYTAEQVLNIDPEVVVTNPGMGESLCEHSSLSMMRACSVPGGIVEVDDALLGDPGPAMVEAAQVVRDRVYGPVSSQGSFQR